MTPSSPGTARADTMPIPQRSNTKEKDKHAPASRLLSHGIVLDPRRYSLTRWLLEIEYCTCTSWPNTRW